MKSFRISVNRLLKMFSHPDEPQMEIDAHLFLERAMGIGPTYSAWKAAALPLCYARIFHVRKLGYYTPVFLTCQEEIYNENKLPKNRIDKQHLFR